MHFHDNIFNHRKVGIAVDSEGSPGKDISAGAPDWEVVSVITGVVTALTEILQGEGGRAVSWCTCTRDSHGVKLASWLMKKLVSSCRCGNIPACQVNSYTLVLAFGEFKLYHTPDIQIDLSEPLDRLPYINQNLGSKLFFVPAKLPSLIASQVKFGHLATNWPYILNGRLPRHTDCTSGRRIKIRSHFGTFLDSLEWVENWAKIGFFFCEDTCSRGPSFSHTFNMTYTHIPDWSPVNSLQNECIWSLVDGNLGELGTLVQTYEKFVWQKVWFSNKFGERKG
jgi:hypothetical protein